jgi:hypothetical protein
MYYEEKQWSDGKWYARTSPKGLWHEIDGPIDTYPGGYDQMEYDIMEAGD